jgi:hypothetical protein
MAIMTKREQYGLSFYKWKDAKSGNIYSWCKREEVGSFSSLQILNRLDSKDSEFLIGEIIKVEQGLYYDNLPTSDSFEDILIEYSFPHVTIDQILTIPMTDFKELLEEWIIFIKS